MTARGGSRWTELNERGVEAAHKAYRRDGLSGRAHDAQLRAALWAYVAAVFPVGEPDDGRLVEERVARAIKKAIHLPCGITGDPNVDAALHLELARAAVAAVRAAGEERVTASEAKSVLSHMPALRGTPIFEKFERIAGGRRDA